MKSESIIAECSHATFLKYTSSSALCPGGLRLCAAEHGRRRDVNTLSRPPRVGLCIPSPHLSVFAYITFLQETEDVLCPIQLRIRNVEERNNITGGLTSFELWDIVAVYGQKE